MKMTAQVDQQQLTHFLSTLYRDATSGYLNIWERQNKRSYWYPIANWEDSAHKISQLVEKNYDVYFGVGLLQAQKSEKERGKASEVCFIPGVWMDIDCSEGTHVKSDLPSFEQAFQFIQSLRIKPSIIVQSGGGYHVYWLFKQGGEINASEEKYSIKELVRGFQNSVRYLAALEGWQFDNTSDLARVLRVPGTLNFKSPQEPKEVKIISESDIRYSVNEIHAFISDNAPKREQAEDNDIKERNYPPSNAKLVLDKCAFLRHSRAKAATLSEPDWFAMVGVLSFAEGGLELVHDLSRPYPKYNEKETTDKITRALGGNGIGKPMTCAAIQEKCGDTLCINCPFKGRIKSPIVLGMDVQENHRTDLGNAERFSRQHGEHLRFNAVSHKWLIWTGSSWQEDETAQIIQLAKQTVRSIYNEGDFTEDEDERKKIKGFALRSEAEPRIRAFLKLAQSEGSIPVLPSELDADPWMLNVRNGVVDLKTGQLLPHRPDYLMTKVAPVNFIPGATCPNWLQFLHRIMGGNQELIDFIQRAIGYSLTGDTSEQVLFLLNGTGRNGKSTLVTIVQELLGDYAQQAQSDTLLSKNKTGINNDIARLNGMRLVSASETDEGKRLDESLIKQLTGGDKITARFLFNESFEFTPICKLFLTTNHLPNIRGRDEGIWRRIRLIPFQVQIPEHEVDTRLTEKLRHEFSGILRWAVEGCLKWQSEGLAPPSIIFEATAMYRSNLDTMANYLSERCITGPDKESTHAALYDDYKQWAVAAGEYVLSQREFTKRLRERGYVDKRIGRNGSRGFTGIEVKPILAY